MTVNAQAAIRKHISLDSYREHKYTCGIVLFFHSFKPPVVRFVVEVLPCILEHEEQEPCGSNARTISKTVIRVIDICSIIPPRMHGSRDVTDET